MPRLIPDNTQKYFVHFLSNIEIQRRLQPWRISSAISRAQCSLARTPVRACISTALRDAASPSHLLFPNPTLTSAVARKRKIGILSGLPTPLRPRPWPRRLKKREVRNKELFVKKCLGKEARLKALTLTDLGQSILLTLDLQTNKYFLHIGLNKLHCDDNNYNSLVVVIVTEINWSLKLCRYSHLSS